jgi:hypothetical protein
MVQPQDSLARGHHRERGGAEGARQQGPQHGLRGVALDVHLAVKIGVTDLEFPVQPEPLADSIGAGLGA